MSGEWCIARQSHLPYCQLFPMHLWTVLLRSHGDCAGTGDLCGDGSIAALRTFYSKLF